MLTHAIEKGFSLKNVRGDFGVAKIKNLVNLLCKYVSKYGYDDNLRVPISLIFAYQKFRENQHNLTDELENLFAKVDGIVSQYNYCKSDFVYAGTKTIMRQEMLNLGTVKFSTLVHNRHSVRNFDNSKRTDTLEGKIKEAINIAKYSPSACNRQAYRVHVYKGDDKKKALTDFFTELRTYGKEIREEAKQAQAKAQEAQQQAKAAQQQTKEAAQPEQQKEVVAKAKTETQQALNAAKGTKDDSNLLVRGFNFISKMVKTGAAKVKSVMGVIKQVFSKTKDQYSSPQAADWARKYIEFKTAGKGERVDDNLKIWNDNDKRLILESIKQIEAETAKVANAIDENAEGKYNI